MKKTDFWGFARRALWIPIAYFGMKGCFDSACAEAQEIYNPTVQEEVIEYEQMKLPTDLYRK